MGMALSEHDSDTHPAQFQRRIYRGLWLKSVPKAAQIARIRLSSAEPRQERSLIRRAGTRQMTAARSIPKPWGALETP